MAEQHVTLSEAIRELRSQLLDAVLEGDKKAIRFMPKSVEVELGIVLGRDLEGGGGVKIWSVVDVSGKAKSSEDFTHKVKLVLEPVGPDGKPTLISSDVLEDDDTDNRTRQRDAIEK